MRMLAAVSGAAILLSIATGPPAEAGAAPRQPAETGESRVPPETAKRLADEGAIPAERPAAGATGGDLSASSGAAAQGGAMTSPARTKAADYPPCRSRTQDRCRVAPSRR